MGAPRKRTCRHVRFAETAKNYDGISETKNILHRLVVDILHGELRSPVMVARACGILKRSSMVDAWRLLDSLINKLQAPGTMPKGVSVAVFRGGLAQWLQQPMLPTLRILRLWLGAACIGGGKENVETFPACSSPTTVVTEGVFKKPGNHVQIGVYPPPGYSCQSLTTDRTIRFRRGDDCIVADVCVFVVDGQQHFVAVACGAIKQCLIRDCLQRLAASQTKDLWSRIDGAVCPGSTHPFAQFMEFAYDAAAIEDQMEHLDSGRVKRMLCMATWMGVGPVVEQCQEQLRRRSWRSGSSATLETSASAAKTSGAEDTSCLNRKRPFCVFQDGIAVR